MNPITNRNQAEWLRLCVELELAEDFENIFEDDKAEFDPLASKDHFIAQRYIEDFLEDDDER